MNSEPGTCSETNGDAGVCSPLSGEMWRLDRIISAAPEPSRFSEVGRLRQRPSWMVYLLGSLWELLEQEFDFCSISMETPQ